MVPRPPPNRRRRCPSLSSHSVESPGGRGGSCRSPFPPGGTPTPRRSLPAASLLLREKAWLSLTGVLLVSGDNTDAAEHGQWRRAEHKVQTKLFLNTFIRPEQSRPIQQQPRRLTETAGGAGASPLHPGIITEASEGSHTASRWCLALRARAVAFAGIGRERCHARTRNRRE